MNYHPLLVHFPIAFLTIYCLLELIRSKRVIGQSYWFYIKGVMVAVGTISAIPSYFSGRAIMNFFPEEIIEVHSNFALATIIFFGLISLSYLLSWMKRDFDPKLKIFIIPSRMLILMSLGGLVLITLTGALGGIIAFGPETDPITSLINGLFFGK